MARDFIHKVRPFHRVESLVMDMLTPIQVDLILPEEVYEHLNRKLAVNQNPPHYCRVTMTLGDVLSGEFFTEYIKKGMFSQASQMNNFINAHD